MIDKRLFEELGERMNEAFRSSPAADLEKNLKALLMNFFGRVDLVTREEFDVQRQVLLRTREKIAQLEAHVAELERKLAAQDAQAPDPHSGGDRVANP